MCDSCDEDWGIAELAKYVLNRVQFAISSTSRSPQNFILAQLDAENLDRGFILPTLRKWT
jgi:hypothetical protein